MVNCHPRLRIPLFASLLIAIALFAACSQGHRSPTDPDTMSAASPSTLAAATHGNGGNGGNGNGGGHGHGGGDLTLALQPDVWNTNWAHSQGTVSALITGSNLDQIDLSSIMLLGNTSGGTGVAAVRADRHGNHVRAFFKQSDAIGALDHPQPGQRVTVQVQFTQNGTTVTLSTQVRIVGPGGSGGGGGNEALQVEIQPNHWNLNFAHSSGTVTALITGSNLDQIDLKSIVLIGTDPAAAPLPATRADRHGNHVRAFWHQSDAIKTLQNPQPGHKYDITIEVSVNGTKTDLTGHIVVEGTGH